MELIRIAADNNDLDLAPYTKVMGAFLEAGADAASVKVYDSATVAGTEKFSLKALTNTTSPQVLFPNGLVFKTAISVDITGTTAILYLMVE